MNCYIITGSSRGLGAAITAGLFSNDSLIHSISRHRNKEIIKEAECAGAVLHWHETDLNNSSILESLLEGIFDTLDQKKLDGIYLVNNAAVLQPIKPIDRSDSEQIVQNINVNLVAPILLSSLFIKLTADWKMKKRIINISSGAGKKPHYGWSTYCSAKSGLDIFTRCVAIEQEERQYPVQIVSFTPGIIDTDMQSEIRSTNVNDFIERDAFIKYKDQGKLLPPDLVAGKVLNLLFEEEIIQGGIYDIREML
jgi:benzil reductase ((S)-benzoin forming)